MPRLTPALDRFASDVHNQNVTSLHTDRITLRGVDAHCMLLEIAALKRELQQLHDDNSANLERMRVTLLPDVPVQTLLETMAMMTPKHGLAQTLAEACDDTPEAAPMTAEEAFDDAWDAFDTLEPMTLAEAHEREADRAEAERNAA